MVVNGSDPGAVFFRDTVTVQPNTNYLFTAWILNLFKVTGYPNPELGVRILNPEGDVLYSACLLYTSATAEKGHKLFDYACKKLLDILNEIADINY